jgi:regulator of replication initiation timing
MTEQMPADALSMPIEDLTRALGQLYLQNVALQAEVKRLRDQLTVLDSPVPANEHSKEFANDGR